MYSQDKRIVLTLDAGGQSFRFSAMRGNEEIVSPIKLIPDVSNIEHCLDTLVKGFGLVIEELQEAPVAISFAFPGPADYPQGIIGDLPNLSAFKGGVPVKAFLEYKFGLPTFINNDGDLFAYGEALAGFLPYVNQMLENAGSSRRYKNLIGVTLGTGFGCGIVRDKELTMGDNAAAAEVWCMRGKNIPDCIVEDCVNSNAVIRMYKAESGASEDISAHDIYSIAKGLKDGNQKAAIHSFEVLGDSLGDALANILAVVDGLVVIGGGVAGARDLFMPAVLNGINTTIGRSNGTTRVPRTELTAYYTEDDKQLLEFLKGTPKKLTVPGTNITVDYDPVKRIAIGFTRLGDTCAMSVGAYCFALNQLDKN